MIAVFLGVANVCIFLFTVPMQITMNTIAASTWQRLLFVLVTNAALYGTLTLLSRKKHEQLLHSSSITLFIIVNVSVIAIIDLIYLVQEQLGLSTPTSTAISGLTLLISILSLLLHDQMAAYANRALSFERRLKVAAIERKHFADMRETYETLDRIRHDLKHHLHVAQTLREGGYNERAAEYLNHVTETLPPLFATGSIVLDALLLGWDKELQKKGIRFKYMLCSMPDRGEEDLDLSSIMGNMLENAAEGVNRIESAPDQMWISLTLRHMRDMLFIECKNPVNPEHVQLENGKFISSKRKNRMGLGLKSMELAVAKYKGNAHFSVEGGLFQTTLIMPLDNPGQEQDAPAQLLLCAPQEQKDPPNPTGVKVLA